MNFITLKGLTIPEGNVTKVTDANGITLWMKSESSLVAFADSTWEQIIAACQSGIVPDAWKIGDQKPMPINGTDYMIDIIGKSHDAYTDGSGLAPLTLQMHDCYTSRAMNRSNTNVGGWGGSVMRSSVVSEILSYFPANIKSAIKAVDKLTSAGNRSTTITTTSDKLFPLSEVEITGESSKSAPGEGKQYAYYANGGSRTKKLNGSVTKQNTRSPFVNGTTAFCAIETSGSVGSGMAATEFGVSFAFCF